MMSLILCAASSGYVFYSVSKFIYEYFMLLHGETLSDGEQIEETREYKTLVKVTQPTSRASYPYTITLMNSSIEVPIRNQSHKHEQTLFTRVIPENKQKLKYICNYDITDFSENTPYNMEVSFVQTAETLSNLAMELSVPYTVFPVVLPLKQYRIHLPQTTPLYMSKQQRLIGTDMVHIAWMTSLHRQKMFTRTAAVACLAFFSSLLAFNEKQHPM